MDAVGSRTEYYPNGTVKHLVLDNKVIGRHNLFLLHGNHKYPRNGEDPFRELRPCAFPH